MSEGNDIRYFNDLPACIAIFKDERGELEPVFVNDELITNMGMDPVQLASALASDPSSLVHPDDVESLRLMLYKGGVTGGNFSEAMRLHFADGSYSWMNVRLNAAPREDGSFIFSFVLIDINDQKENDLKLEHTYEELLGVMNNTPGGIIVFKTKNNRDPIPDFASPGLFRMLLGTREEIMRLYHDDFYGIIHPDDREKAVRTLEDAIRNLSNFQSSIRLRTFNGNYILVDTSGTVEVTGGQRNLYVACTNASADSKAKLLLKQVLNIFVQHQFDNISVVDLDANTFQLLSTNKRGMDLLPSYGDDYDTAVCKAINRFVIPEECDYAQTQMSRAFLRETLPDRDSFEILMTVNIPGRGLRYKRMWIGWVDKTSNLVSLVMSDFTDIKNQQDEQKRALSDALKAAEQANIAKSVFLSRMSHDIRTPLNAIIGFTEISLADKDSGEATLERLGKIHSASEYLLFLINDVLDMSRIESGKYILADEPFAMKSFMAEIDAIINTQCAEKGLSYSCETDDNVRSGYIGDRLKLQRVIVNILGNSVKFTPSGGSISMRVSETASYESHAMLRFTISDTGIGISKEFLPHIFDTFTQEKSNQKKSVDSPQPGTGLGLAICKNIVGLMGGNINAVSEKGRGSEFTVDVKLGISDETQFADENMQPDDESAIPEYDFSGKRILLAEDNPMNQEIAQYLLETVGFQVEVACNGLIACEMIESHCENYYDAVLLDIRMPVMDGLEAARHIRSMKRSDAGSIPLIALSADAFEEDISKSLSIGIDAHLIKPIDSVQLCSTLANYLLK